MFLKSQIEEINVLLFSCTFLSSEIELVQNVYSRKKKKSETRQYRPCYITMFIESFAKRAHLELNIALYAFLIKTDLQVT